MNDQSFQNVDDLLASWSEQQQPSAEKLEQLNDAVCDELVSDRTELSADTQRSSPSAWVALSVAAALLMAIGAGVWMSTRPDHRTKVIVDAPTIKNPIESFSVEQRIQKQNVLAELDRMFTGKRVWFAETASDVVLGGEAEKTSSEFATNTVAMRLVLAKRSLPTESWQRVWSADVVSRTDQVVQFISQDTAQPETNYTAWAHLLPDGLVACDVELRWDDGKPSELRDSLLLSPDNPETGASINVDGVEYQLFHAVSLLDKVAT